MNAFQAQVTEHDSEHDSEHEGEHVTQVSIAAGAHTRDMSVEAESTEGELRYVPLSKLVPSPLNVRKSGGENIDELAMLIDSQGLLQNLIVIPHVTKHGKATDKFEVVAGGRRRRALVKLAELGKIAKDEEILCKLTTKAQALAASAAENSGREAMSVADSFQAFAGMVAGGAGVEEVAVCFGITPMTVKRRLKLANVSPKLFELFRQEKVSLEQLMALAISDDHEAQERVWNATASYERHASNLRRQLLGREIDVARDPVVRFVGVQAYEAAGGVIVRDLFEDGEDAGFIGDAELLHRLAKDKLDAEAAKMVREGWSWIETRTAFDHSERHRFADAPMGRREASEKERAKIDAWIKQQEDAEAALETMYESGEDAVDQDEAGKLEEQADKARREIDKLHAKMRRWTPEVLAVAGAIVTIDHSGAIDVRRGLVKPEDMKAAKKVVVSRPGQGAASASDEPQENDKAALSEALHRKLTAHRTKALQVLVADNTHVALASVVHALVQQLLIEHSYGSVSALSLRASGCEASLEQFADDMKGSKADSEMQSRLDNWRERIPSDAAKLLPWLIGQEQDTLLELLALCAAVSINTVTACDAAHPGDALASAVGLNMADFWTATGTSYFAQVSKAQIVAAVSEAVSVEAGAGLAKLKKGEAVARAEVLVAGTRWLPVALRSH